MKYFCVALKINVEEYLMGWGGCSQYETRKKKSPYKITSRHDSSVCKKNFCDTYVYPCDKYLQSKVLTRAVVPRDGLRDLGEGLILS